MTASQIQMLITIIAYLAIIVGVGFAYTKKSTANSESYFLGGRSLWYEVI